MISRREFLKTCAAGFAALMAGCRKKDVHVEKNPYEYDIEKFKKIDDNLILYEELPPLSLDVRQLRGIAVSSDDMLFAAADKNVFIFDSTGRALKSFETEGEARCIAARTGKGVYLGMNDHVEIYDRYGDIIRKCHSLGENASISSMAVSDDLMVIADYTQKQLWLFDMRCSLRGFIQSEDDTGSTRPFTIPSPCFDVDFDKNGSIWVVHTGKLRLENYSTEGNLISYWGGASMELSGFTGCCNPEHFIIHPDGGFVTAEKGLIRIKVYDKTGKFKGVVAGPDKFKEGTTGHDLAVNSRGDIFVADPARKMIRVFALKKGSRP